jgi:hypothetical protein
MKIQMSKEETKCCNCQSLMVPIASWATFGKESLGIINYCSYCGTLFYESYRPYLQESHWKTPYSEQLKRRSK